MRSPLATTPTPLSIALVGCVAQQTNSHKCVDWLNMKHVHCHRASAGGKGNLLMSSDQEYSINVYVFSKEPEKVAKAAEALARTSAGLALEGIDVNLRFGTLDVDDDDA
jgi:hypothetical protein